MRVLALFAVGALAGKGALGLTEKNFDDVVFNSGKGSLIKFQAPWCGHCKKLKPDWDKLADKFADSDAVTVVDVDCTDKKAESLCQKYGVKGYPSLKYKLADSKSFQDYNGAREFAGLKTFVEQTFKSACNPTTKKGCAPNEVEFIEKWADKSAAEVKEEKERREADVKAVGKEKREAEAEWKKVSKDLTKKEKNLKKSLNVLKELEKAAKKAEL